ncbi:MAG: hypothetical protein WCP93_02145 [Candidatus Berkelbacteria bacterium]
MDHDDKKLGQIRKLLEEIEEKVHSVRRIMFEQVYQEEAENLDSKKTGPVTIIEGVFDGQEMIDKDGNKYIIPANYASKSKLVPGDKMKLTITPDGSFIFKQIGPIERRRLIGKLQKAGDRWIVSCDGKKYQCLQPSVTYYKAKAGDKVTIIVPKVGEADWAAIDNLLEKK